MRAFVTGLGIVSPLGNEAPSNLESLKLGRSGISFLQSFDTSGYTCRIGGEVRRLDIGPARHDRFTALALVAAAEAVADAKLDGVDSERLGVLIGTGLGGSTTLDDAYLRLYGRGLTRLPPLTIPHTMYNAATSAVAGVHGARGPSFAVVSACASANHSIGQAAHWIRNGLADVVIAGGSDAPICPGVIRGWEALRVLAADTDPTAACRPFDSSRKGLVISEGAAVVILESEASVVRRGVEPLAEIAGFGMSNDAGHLTDPSVTGAVSAMKMAIRDGGLQLEDIEYINAHGTGTRANDETEAAAIRALFGEGTDSIPVSSTKSMHGHAMGASGAIELVLSILAVRSGFLPPTINLTTPDPACRLQHVANEAKPARPGAFLSNSFGFGGMNAVLAVRMRWPDIC